MKSRLKSNAKTIQNIPKIEQKGIKNQSWREEIDQKKSTEK